MYLTGTWISEITGSGSGFFIVDRSEEEKLFISRQLLSLSPISDFILIMLEFTFTWVFLSSFNASLMDYHTSLRR